MLLVLAVVSLLLVQHPSIVYHSSTSLFTLVDLLMHIRRHLQAPVARTQRCVVGIMGDRPSPACCSRGRRATRPSRMQVLQTFPIWRQHRWRTSGGHYLMWVLPVPFVYIWQWLSLQRFCLVSDSKVTLAHSHSHSHYYLYLLL